MGEQAVEAAAEFLGLNLAGISRAYRGDVIGVLQAGLDGRSLAVEFQAVDDEGGVGQQQRSEQVFLEHPVEGEVVYGENTAATRQRMTREMGAGEPCMPIVPV